ncbi:DUF6262 family protein [Streptomyces spororaveus]|uniref:DUF6262 family protein n=1 Tax=Streptomyces spororaveus TaxID=284039 RepID=UPI0036A51FA5
MESHRGADAALLVVEQSGNERRWEHDPAALDRTGAPVSFEGVARRAGISRSWLYGQPDIRAEIERLRDATQRSPSLQIPAAERSSDGSLHARLEAALERNRQLTEENQRLRRQLAHALGDQRASLRIDGRGAHSAAEK